MVELFPRPAFLLPPGTLSTVARLRVGTRARARSSTRVGLSFVSVGLEPVSLLGADVSSWLPRLSAPLPTLPGADGADSDASSSFFDVAYLDEELLVIRQNSPGGTFVAVRDGFVGGRRGVA